MTQKKKYQLTPLYDIIYVKPLGNKDMGLNHSASVKDVLRDAEIVAVGTTVCDAIKVGQKIRIVPHSALSVPFIDNTYRIAADDILFIYDEETNEPDILPNNLLLIDKHVTETEIAGFILPKNVANQYNDFYTATIVKIGINANKEGENYKEGEKIICNIKAGTPCLMNGEKYRNYYTVRGAVDVIGKYVEIED